jgi:hypothetical protein
MSAAASTAIGLANSPASGGGYLRPQVAITIGLEWRLPPARALPHADRMGFRAVKNALMELGEAVKALSEEVLQRHPTVDWKGFAGLRDMITHQYFGLDTQRLLPIIRDEVPGLLVAVEAELGPDYPEDTPPGLG